MSLGLRLEVGIAAYLLLHGIAASHLLHYADAAADISFSLKGATGSTYTRFMYALKVGLGPDEISHNIPVLRHSVPNDQRCILVDLANYASTTISLAIDVTNIYVVAYRAGNQFFFFSDVDPGIKKAPLFSHDKLTSLSFSGSYIDLERIAGLTREKISLGPTELDNAIDTLWRTESLTKTKNLKPIAKSLIVIIQMVSEAARYTDIMNKIKSTIPEGSFKPKSDILSLENNWGALSSAIQNARADGSFITPVQLQHENGTFYKVQNVSSVISKIALLLYQRAAGTTTNDPVNGEQ